MPKSREPCLVFWIVLGEASHHADVSPLIGRLGAGGTQHRYRYTGDKRDEFAAPHVPLTPSIRPYHIVVGNAALCITAEIGRRW
jgi:hypothetical protein